MRFLTWQQASLQHTVLSTESGHRQSPRICRCPILWWFRKSHKLPTTTQSERRNGKHSQLRIQEVPGWRPRRRRPNSRPFTFFIRVARRVPGRYNKLAKIAPWHVRSNDYTWFGRKVMRMATLCTNRQCCCFPLRRAVRLTPAVDSVQVWTCYNCYVIVESVWREVVLVRCVTKMDRQKFEQSCAIKFCVKLGESATVTYEKL